MATAPPGGGAVDQYVECLEPTSGDPNGGPSDDTCGGYACNAGGLNLSSGLGWKWRGIER